MTRRQTFVYASLAATVAVLAGLFPRSTEAATTLTFVPVADAQVNSGNPTGNYGSLATIRTREATGTPSDPTYRSFLTFDVSGVGGQSITSVTLRLYVTDASPNGQGIHRVPDPTLVGIRDHVRKSADVRSVRARDRARARPWVPTTICRSP